MKLMRHGDIKLTAKVYTDETQLPIYEAIKGLPRLGGCTQIRTQISGADGQNVAQPVAIGEGKKSDKTGVNGGDCLGLAPLVAEMKLERAKGFEPSTQKPQPIQTQNNPQSADSGYTQIRAQILGELGPELAQVVAKWPKLPPTLKAAVLAIVGTVCADGGNRERD
ncbi:MAG: hypothetical protein ACLQUR_02880 [Limisphaerales bacterium]